MKKLVHIVFLFVSISSFAQNREYLLAENYFKNNEFEKATSLFVKLSQRNQYNLKYLNRLITCYQETGKYNKADSYLKELFKKQPNLIFLNVLIGKNYEKQKDTINAKKFYNKAILEIEKQVSFGTTVANMFEKHNKLDYAIKSYQKIATLKNVNYNMNIANLYGQQGKFKDMFEAYFDFIDKNPGNSVHAIKYRTAQYVTDDAKNANNILFKKSLLKRSASNPKPEWNKLLAWLFTKQKEYSKALIQNKALFARKEINIHGLKKFGNITFENKAYPTATKTFKFIIENSKNDREKVEALTYILKIDVATKQQNIESKFEEILKKYGVNRNTLSIQIVYADYLTFQKNTPIKANEILERALTVARSPYKKADIKLKLADILVYQNKFNKALIYFSQIQSKFRNHELGQEARLKVAQTSYFKGDFKWAKAQVKVLKGSATQLIANDAADLFITISDNQPKDSVPTGLKKFAKASLLAYQNKNKEALTLLDEIITKYKGQGIEDEALFESAKIWTKEGNFKKSIEQYNKLIQINKGVLIDDGFYNLAEIYLKQGNKVKAKENYEKVILDHPSSIYLVDARNKYRKLRGDKVKE